MAFLPVRQTPWVCSHISSRDTCHSLEPRSGVICALGSCSSMSTYSRRNRPRSRAVLLFRVSRTRSEEHTSELQSLMRSSYAVFCLKKNKKKQNTNKHNT